MTSTAPATLMPRPAGPAPVAPSDGSFLAEHCTRHRIADTLGLLDEALAPQRRLVHAGDVLHQAGGRFRDLHVVNAGMFKIVNLSADGREQVVDLKYRGDWLGLDGIADGRYACEAVAMDTGEVWAIRYDALLAACAVRPALLTLLHEAMSRQIGRGCESLTSICARSADARVAGFLCQWMAALAERGLRTDQITLRLTRAEIGNYLGMTLETVSRTLSKLARDKIIAFAGKGRRDIRIADPSLLADFMQHGAAPASALLLQ